MVQRVVVCLVLLLAGGASARANAGTPLMWVGYFHLLVGNFLIGVWEAAVLARRFNLPNRPVGLMVAANYVSAVAGFVLVFLGMGVSDLLGPALLVVGIPFLLMMVALAFAFTVAIEWPFCLRVAGNGADRKRLAWRMSLTAQIASYAILVPLYVLVAPINALFHVRPLASVARPPAATVYYQSPRDGHVWRIRTDGSGRERVMPIGRHAENPRIAIVPGPKGGAGDLVLLDRAPGQQEYRSRVLRAGFAPAGSYAVADVRLRVDSAGGWDRYTRYFGSKQARVWNVEAGFWSFEGVSFWKAQAPQEEDQHTHLALETPYAALWCRNVTVLPNEQAVLQMGRVLVLLDMPTRRLAVLTGGTSPAVVLEVQNAK